jgi:hypothetical protein
MLEDIGAHGACTYIYIYVCKKIQGLERAERVTLVGALLQPFLDATNPESPASILGNSLVLIADEGLSQSMYRAG